ncbi:uncharacterized protein LOC135844302 [Planococcus citri]|uniref:uncharacterized protein LOC135844302 n=1 Tax=Planococcus citri TaxID=170843 RepID=UPI0031FA3096
MKVYFEFILIFLIIEIKTHAFITGDSENIQNLPTPLSSADNKEQSSKESAFTQENLEQMGMEMGQQAAQQMQQTGMQMGQQAAQQMQETGSQMGQQAAQQMQQMAMQEFSHGIHKIEDKIDRQTDKFIDDMSQRIQSSV